MEKPLAKNVAVITGASHGLGKAVAKHLASLGADIVLIARNPERLTLVAEEVKALGTSVLAIPCDVSQKAEVLKAAAQIADQMKHVNILINNAGIPAPRTFDSTSFDDWDSVISTNLSSVFYMTRALWDALIASTSGYVITISGTAGVRGSGSPSYGSAKFGLTGLNHAIAQAGKDHQVRATILYPGSMDTGWRGAPIGEKPRSETMNPDDVANLIGHLVLTPKEFVLNEAVLNPVSTPLM